MTAMAHGMECRLATAASRCLKKTQPPRRSAVASFLSRVFLLSQKVILLLSVIAVYSPARQMASRRLHELRSWTWELCALAGSALSFLAIVLLLACFDDRPIFDLYGVSLNVLLSILSVSMKASLTFAVAECIGQWKWILFSRDTRPLLDFEHIDLASRGPLGSITVLWKVRGS